MKNTWQLDLNITLNGKYNVNEGIPVLQGVKLANVICVKVKKQKLHHNIQSQIKSILAAQHEQTMSSSVLKWKLNNIQKNI